MVCILLKEHEARMWEAGFYIRLSLEVAGKYHVPAWNANVKSTRKKYLWPFYAGLGLDDIC